MIIEFSVKNYRSIKDLQTLSMVAAPIKSKNSELDTNNVIKVSDKLSLLKSAGIYGANGSGKSNLIQSLVAMLIIIRDSLVNDRIGTEMIEPFIFNRECALNPTFFQLVFICEDENKNKVRYRYGFEILGNVIKSEWLFGTPKKTETHYFIRKDSTIKINEKKFTEGKGLPTDKLSENNLFLNFVKAFNGQTSKKIIDFFSKKISVSAGVGDIRFRKNTLEIMKHEDFKNKILELLNFADFGIGDIYNKSVVENEEEIESKEKKELLISKRTVYDSTGKKTLNVEWTMDGHESDGTQKFFNYSGVITYDLIYGSALFLDEFDARLHPMLTKKIVEMFNSPTLNKNGAQLVFVTHDTNLLDNSLLRRDQIYFTEKNKMQETVLYSLADFKGIRNDASYEKDYINGKYGAIPFLGDFEKLFKE